MIMMMTTDDDVHYFLSLSLYTSKYLLQLAIFATPNENYLFT